MFLKAVTELPIDFEAVRDAMQGRPECWLGGLAEAAGDDQDRLLVDVGLGDGRRLTRPAMLQLGPPAMLGDRVVSLPLRLRMADRAELFPVLEGELAAAWLGADRTYLALALQYEPPFGLLGRLADGTLLHRVAELVVQHLLERIAGRLTALCAAPVDRTPCVAAV
ncbi:MAG TPA: hypothetical protein VOB72_08150 [Candidatus Dormibacteraeota bacterium]|nr:hypothetical protein [Candidatus Dormibacteraeota bacterium]